MPWWTRIQHSLLTARSYFDKHSIYIPKLQLRCVSWELTWDLWPCYNDTGLCHVTKPSPHTVTSQERHCVSMFRRLKNKRKRFASLPGNVESVFMSRCHHGKSWSNKTTISRFWYHWYHGSKKARRLHMTFRLKMHFPMMDKDIQRGKRIVHYVDTLSNYRPICLTNEPSHCAGKKLQH